MMAALSTMKLHFNKRETTLLVPLYITAMVAVISVLISLLFWRAGSIPGSQEWVESSRYNPGMAWALVGFLVYLGVQSVATTFPFALTLGATRRGFTVGTFLWAGAVAVYLAVVFGVLMLVEVATGHWFSHFYVFDIAILGAGDLGVLLATTFLAVLSTLMVGAVFGASWIRFAARGPQVLGAGVAIVVVVALIVAIPSAQSILAAFEPWWLAVAAAVVSGLSGIGTWLFLRSATVR